MDQLGQQLGPYTLTRLIGQGGMSSVYEATDTRMGRRVAIKVLGVPEHLAEEEQETLIQRMQREARVVAALSHPNIVTLFDIGEQDGTYYLVMEYLDGVTLRQQLARHGPLNYAEAAQVLEQAGDALDAVHAAGVVHRDLKPSNIILLPGLRPERGELRVKLLDFGVAQPSDDVAMTTPGMIVGTPTYLAPELVSGGKATPASDLWAMGVLLYEMLSGRAPFAADTVTAVLYRIAHDQPAPLTEVPSPIQDVVAFALDKDVGQRFTSGRALANAFRAAMQAADVGDLPPTLEMSAAAMASATSERTTAVSPRRPMPAAPVPPAISTPAAAPSAIPARREREERRPLSGALLAGLLLFALAVGSMFILRSGRNTVAVRPSPTVAAPTPEAAETRNATPAPSPRAARPTPKPAAPPPGPRVAVAPVPTVPTPRTATPSPSPRPTITTPRPQTPRPPTPRPLPAATPETRRPPTPMIEERPAPTPSPTPEARRPDPTPKPTPTVRPIPETTPRAPEIATERNSDIARTPPPPPSTEEELPPPETAERLAELATLRDEWIAANEAREVQSQARFYLNRLERYYTLSNVPRAQVIRDKAFVVGGADKVVMRAAEPVIELSEDEREAIMTFRKDYVITGGRGARKGAVLQELRWRRTRDGWKIYSERDLRVLW